MNPIRETILAIAVIGVVGCSTPKVADVSDSVKTSLKQQGYNDVSVKDDTQKGVVTLSGKVPSDQDKTNAEGIAKSQAGSQVVADEILVLPPGGESTAKDVNSDLDKGIEANLDAALLQNGLNKEVTFQIKSGVVKLTGEVESQSLRSKAQDIAARIPNVQQVVNELQVKNQRASSTTN
jgi:hyperosmotically inducible protein